MNKEEKHELQIPPLTENYNAPRKLYMMRFNHGCDKNKRIANFGESDAAQKFFSRV